MTKPSEDVQ